MCLKTMENIDKGKEKKHAGNSQAIQKIGLLIMHVSFDAHSLSPQCAITGICEKKGSEFKIFSNVPSNCLVCIANLKLRLGPTNVDSELLTDIQTMHSLNIRYM